MPSGDAHVRHIMFELCLESIAMILELGYWVLVVHTPQRPELDKARPSTTSKIVNSVLAILVGR